MNRWSSWGFALVLAGVLAISARAQDKDKKDPDKKVVPDKKDPLNKDDKKPPMPPAPPPKTITFNAELVHVETGKQAFRVKYPQQHIEINEGAARGILQAQQQMAQAMARRPPDVQGYRNAAIELAKHQANLRQVKTNWKELTLEASEKMEVRLPSPKAAFDEMGNVKKYTKEELDKLRGKDRMFEGAFDDLTNGQIVSVTILQPKAPMKVLNKDDLQLEENKIEAIRVAVIKQPTPK